jgi:CRP/FNR family transcriptional regulator, cyclic AMP receptor protein
MPASPEALALLKKIDLFGGLPESQLASCAAVCAPARFAAGTLLFGRGDPGDRLFIVAEGRVRLSLVSEDGRELSVRVACAHDVLGELSVLDGAPRSTDAEAIDAVRAFVLLRRDFTRLLTELPALAESSIQFLCRRLRKTTDQLEAIALHSVEQRLARQLLSDIGEAPAVTTHPLPSLALPQAELAQLIGASRPKVNAALSSLERQGALVRSTAGHRVDAARLRRLAGLADD